MKYSKLVCSAVLLLAALFLVSATAHRSDASSWPEHTVGNLSLKIPPAWQPLSAKKLKQSPFRAAWFLGDQEKPDAGVAIFNLSFVPNVKKKLVSYKASATTVGGRAARQYSIDFEGDGSSTAIVSVVPGAGPNGAEVALMHFAPTKKWPAQKAILEQIIATIRFGGSGSSPPSVVKPTAPPARQTGYYQLDFLRHYNMKRPEATFKVDGIPVSGYQGGKAHVVWLAKGKTPADHKTPFPTSYSWPVPSYTAKEILIATNLAWWDNALKDKPVVRLTVRGSGGSRSFDLKVGRHTAEWNGGAIAPAPGVVVKTGVPGPSRRWFIARFPLGSMIVTRVDVKLLDAPRWGAESAVVEIHGITLLGKSATAATSGRQPAAGDTSGASGPQSGSSAGVSGASVAPTAGTSGIRLFRAVKSRSSSKFAGRPANRLRMQTTRWNKIPFHMAPVFRGTVTRKSGQKIFLAGDAAGKAGWSVDNFLLLAFSSSQGTRRVVVGGAEPVLLGGARITQHGPNRSGFTADKIDLTGFFPVDVPVILTAEALDYGGVGYLSDVYLVIKGGPAGGSPAAAAPPVPAATGAPKGGGYWRMVKIVGTARKLGKHNCYIYKASGREGTAHYSIQNRCGKPPGRFAGVVHWDRPPAILWPGKPFPITLSVTRTAVDPNYKHQGIGLHAALEPVRVKCGYGTAGSQRFTVSVDGRSADATARRTQQFTMPDGRAKSRTLALRYCARGWSQQYIYQWIPKGKKGAAVQSPPLPSGTRQEVQGPDGGNGSAPPSGASPAKPTSTATSTPSLRPGQAVYMAGRPISVHFSGFPGNAKDWIAVTRADLPDNKYGQWTYLAGKKSGTLSFKGLPAGRYQVRGYLNWRAGGYKVVARAIFTVTPAPVVASQPSLKIAKTQYAPGEEIQVAFTASAAYDAKAWVGIIPSHVAHGKESVNDRHDLTYQYVEKRTSGVMTFKAPTKPGSYDFRMNDTDAGTGREVASVGFKVAGTATATPTTLPAPSPTRTPPTTVRAVPTTVPSPPTTQRAVSSTTTTTTQPKRDYSASVVLRPTKPVFRPGEPIVVHASGLPRFPQMHVSIGPAGASGLKTRQNIKTHSKPEGTFTFRPQVVGRYRIMVWPDPNKMGYSILKTTTVEVKAPPLTATIEQPKVEYNTGQKRIKVTVRPKSLVFVPATLVAVPLGAPSILKDHSQVKFHKRFPGLKTIPMNVDAVVGFKPGQYEWRLYEPDTKGRIVAKLPFTVIALGPDSPVPDNMTKLPFSDRFSPSAACWRTEGLGAVVKDYVLTVDTSKKRLRTAFSIPLENISVVLSFKANGQPLSVKWGAVPGQGYGLRITPAKSGGQATATILADGMRTSLATAKVRLGRGAWHQVYLRRIGDDLELRFDGKMVAKVKTARRYQGGAPLTIRGGKPLSVKAVEVLYPSDAPHSGGYQKVDPRFCSCGPRVLESWLGGLQQHSWRITSGKDPKFTVKFFKSETELTRSSSGKLSRGIRVLRTRAVAKGKGPCQPGSVRAVFSVGRANSATAYLETYLVMGLGSGSHNFPHLKIELLDDKSKVLGSQLYYAPSAVSPASRANAERRKYAKLKRSAGVVRLYLKEVKPNIEFSQIAISLVNFVCQGDNDITVDQIIFCPSGDCPLSLTEKIDQAAVLAEIERLFVDFEITQSELMRLFIVAPTVSPLPQPPLRPAGSSSLRPAIYTPNDSWAQLPLREGETPCCRPTALWRTVAAGGGCDKEMDKAIKEMRRTQVSLGHDNQLKKALWDMAKSLAKDVKLSPGGLKRAQEWIGKAMDEGEWAYQLYGEVESGKHKEAVQRVALAMFKRLHKKLLDECDKSLQLKKYSKTIRTAWAKSLKKLPPKLRRAELARLKAVVGSKLSDEEFHRWIQQKGFDMAAGVDVGKSGGQAAGGEYKAALCTLITTTATTLSPAVRVVKAALLVYYESLRAVRDLTTDDRTQDMYDAYCKWYDKSRGGQGFFDAHSMRDRYSLHKVRVVLAKKRGTTHDKVSDDDAWKFLKVQFGKWRAAEIKAEQQSDTLSKLKAQFAALPAGCRRGLDKILWPKGKYGLTHAYRNRFDPCYYDMEAFKSYGKLWRDIRADLKTWARPGTFCNSNRVLDDKTSLLACKFLTGGAESYKRSLAATLKACKWLPKPKVVILSANQARLAPRLTRMSETRLQVMLRGIGKEGLLNCLCGARILMGVGGGYSPKPLPDSPACKKVSNGLCAFGNWGCQRFPLPTTAEALKKCGVFDAVIQWQIKRRKGMKAR